MSSSVVPYSFISVPHSRCNKITEDGLILLGAKPTIDTLPLLLTAGVKLFINLEDNKEKDWYKDQLTDNIEYVSIPTKSGSPPSLKSAQLAFEKIQAVYSKKEISYIHCSGGHGRAGTLGAFLLGRMKNITAPQAIQEIELWRESRPDTSRNFIPTPESVSQVKFLVKQLGVKDGEIIPDRTNTDWLKKVKKERKQR
jgi:protein-tyrosine phosphatase